VWVFSKSMNVEQDGDLLKTLVASRDFKHHRCQWVLFYGGTFATVVSFVILCALSAWTLTVAHDISEVVRSTTSILLDVENMLPILKNICRHSNFTRYYGEVCNI
jgi:hypothetical protein